MSFWDWFKQDGDKLCNFISLSSVALMGLKAEATVPLLSQSVLTGCLVAGILATAAHQSFFTGRPTPAPIKE